MAAVHPPSTMKSKLIKVLVTLAVVLALPLGKTLREAMARKALHEAPFRTRVIEQDRGLASTRHSYLQGPYGVMEIGNLRIAGHGIFLGGESSNGGQGLLFGPNERVNFAGCSSCSIGRYSHVGIDGGLRITCEAITFDVAYREFRYRDVRIDVFGEPALVLLAKDGSIESVTPIACEKPARAKMLESGEMIPLS